MSHLKKKFALFLATIMLISSLSVVSFAEGNTGLDVVVYNLGSREITVGFDTEQAEASPWDYKLFDEYGNYTIELEDNAFFPYEVQFITSSGSESQVICFETPDSTVEVGGYFFSVFSATTNEYTLSQIGFTIGGNYIPAVSEPKVFMQNGGFDTSSLLPFTTVRLSANLKDCLPSEMKFVELSAILATLYPGQSIEASDTVVWVKKSYPSGGGEEFRIAGQNEIIDLSPGYPGDSSVYLELIVSSALHLDFSNKTYFVTIDIPSDSDAVPSELYEEYSTDYVIPADGEQGTDSLVYANADVVVYNLGNQEIIVGYDTMQAEATPWNYKLFDESGNYTIELEDNAFFPYEVMFTTTSGIAPQVISFETPDSIIEFDGHFFRVISTTTDENTLQQIGFTIGDRYIPAVPEPKTFMQSDENSPFPFLPLTTVRAYADLRDYLPADLKSVELSAILSALNPWHSSASDKVVWAKKSYSSGGEEDFRIVWQNERIDLSSLYPGDQYVYLELIVGSAFQLDPNNKRYFVTIDTMPNHDADQFGLYEEDDNNSVVSENTDVVVYNLGSQEITVGYDTEQAEAAPWNYRLFDEGGNYTIELEDNAFFPYEVMFTTTSSSVPQVISFETPYSTVEVDGHFFSVISATTDENSLSQIGFTIGDKYIPAVPEPKTFTQNAGFSPFSLLPLTTLSVTADLRNYLPAELKSVELSAVLSALNPSQGRSSTDKVVWIKKSSPSAKDDNFKIAEQNECIDLSPNDTDGSYVYLELIVGSALQLDPNNKRYIVTIYTTSSNDVLQIELYAKDGTNRKNAEPRNGYYRTENVYNSDTQTYELVPQYQASVASQYTSDTEFYLGMSMNYWAYREIDVEVYKGRYETAEAAASGENVTANVWNQTMSDENAGLLGNYANYQQRQYFTLVYSRNGSVTAVENFILDVYRRSNGVSPRSLYSYDYGYRYDITTTYSSDSLNGIPTYTYTLDKGFQAEKQYYHYMMYYHDSTGVSSIDDYVDKAVVGHFNTLEAAEAEADIKAELFGNGYDMGSGYLADYSGDGQKFTIFAEGSVFKFTIKAVNSTEPDEPDEPGTYPEIPSLSADTYFRIEGVKSGELSLDTYTIPSNDDTYYSKGYQTLLINEADTDMSTLKPEFWVLNPPKAYAGINGAEEQISGISTQDFSKSSVLYTAKAENGSAVKNYEVTFVKKVADAASLFVNGPDAREVFLNNAYENRHDIFIANIGTEALTGLSVTLNATNVKLDQYWTVGGTGNDILAPFTSTGTYNYQTGERELDNIAKIRLLPAEVGDTNYTSDGKIDGTLTITSENGGSREIKITGTAGNPKIITESLADGVKYVPYSRMIQTNNMHDWNTVTFSEMSGSKLPDGLEVLPNGEIYGVPQKTGVFNVIVKADYSYYRFSDSIATFTLTIKENTDENVAKEVDTGYSIEVSIPNIVTSFIDREFKLEGEFSEFMHFYLDGKELVKNTDYTVEDGSTKITVKSQTFQKAGGGKHTIAAEFRVDGDTKKEMKKAAQNYTLNISSGGNTGGDNTGGDNTGGNNTGGNNTGGNNNVSPTTPTPPTPTSPPPTPTSSFNTSTSEITTNPTTSNGVTSADINNNSITSAIDAANNTDSIVTIKVDPKNTNSVEVKLSKNAFERISDNNLMLTINAGAMGIITFDTTALKAINNGSGNSSDSVVINTALGKRSDLTLAQQVLVPDNAVVVKCFVNAGGKTVSDFGKGIVTLNIPFSLPNGVKATQVVPYYLNESNNKLELVMGGYNSSTKAVDLHLRHFSTFVVKINDKQYEGRGGWYDSSLDWAVQRGLLDKFIVDGKINAAQEVSRADFVTALMKALGIHPMTSYTVQQFSDVSGVSATYILTARELGIVNGVGSNRFDPNSTAKRGEQFQIVYNLIQANITTVGSQNTARKISDFDDADTVPEGLKIALSELLRLGVVQGDGTNLNVKDNFTIGEICVVLQKMANPKAKA